jgi:histidinol dehydrogenase
MTAAAPETLIPVYYYNTPSARQALEALRERLSPRGDIVSEAGRARTLELFGSPLTPREVVTRILGEIRRDGRAALLKYAKLLDKPDLGDGDLRVSPAELEAAHQSVDREFLSTVRRIRDNVLEFQRKILHEDVRLVRQDGLSRIELTQRYLPLKRVGICVPGGAAAYPSTILMTAVPAQAAGVKELVVVTPPTSFGAYNAQVLATCTELGIREVYRVGGAQAVAALAYGVERIGRVDKIVGPGNMFVALAKQMVYGEVDIDSIAGPSEVVVIADDSADPRYVASDLLSQAEHSPGSSVLITWHAPLIEAVQAEVARQLVSLPRSELAADSLRDYGAIVLVDSPETACRLTDELAPEHLHLSTAAPQELLEQIQNAGAIFMGHYTPVALGDYFAGPSHVLPTGGTARFANGLCSNDFLKRSSVIQFNRAALEDAAEDVRRIAAVEGLTAHSQSVDIRLEDA